MFKKSSLCILVLLTFSLAWILPAQEAPQPQTEGQERHRIGGPPPMLGTITSVGVDRFEVKRLDGTTQTVMVNDQTHYRQRSEDRDQPPKELALEDLKAGDHVFVRGTPGSDKQVVAVGVNRVTAEQFERFQNGFAQGGGGAGGGRGPDGGGWGPGGGGMEGTRAGGEIESIKGNVITVMSRRRGEMTIVVNDQTTFAKEGQTVALKDLKVGDRIFAMGKEVDGKFTATEVHSGRPRGGGRGGWQGGPGQGGPQN
jgi:Domain of unknown function (DUF5666)